MTISLQGVSVSRGIAIGPVHIIQHDQIDVREYNIERTQLEDEISRFNDAIANARQQLRAIRDHIPSSTSVDISAFIDTHLLMLEDIALTEEPKRIIKEQLCNAEWALKLQRDALVSVFDEMADAYLSTRRDDVDHVVNRILRLLLKQKPLLHEVPEDHLKNKIIIAGDLTPADTVLMQHYGIAAFATEFGGPTSHTAILARSLGIPAIVGLHNARRFIKNSDQAIIDGSTGTVLINPDKKTQLFYEKKQKEVKRYYSSLKKLKNAPTESIDGITVELMANIELPKDFDTVRNVGAKGVGLYRTEFLYMNRESPPEEEEHFETYIAVIKALRGLPLTIRTLDLGADKQVDGAGKQTGSVKSNPALGLRAVRLCLREPELFRPQLRAMLRASAHGPVRIMVPMLTNTQEMQQVLQMIDDLKAGLDADSIAYDPDIQIGGMIEVPAAAICADIFAKKLDFLSIGTNDLIQYTMAIDRVNDEVNYLYDPLHPAVLRLIQTTIKAGEKAKIPVAMCGEMAGEIEYTQLLLGLGLREFSVHPASLLEVKKIINDTNISKLSKLMKKVLNASSGNEIKALLQQTQLK
ncbi:MAG TPA: phosphoenolpyruvate--protein phosphotransferase [Thiotrichaceae bacterium]|jgi:phosphotransferase system enzyme I (PtsI)|nr:phosphoenolpyruvate--protein phosphotransferase [Thiotrichaceae bacterium]HIM07598.1 phosphoenolpyruvate--protein phosphotransferase [Gammaproteobacteria bacterium]